MNLKSIFLSAAVVALPAVASAATLQIDGVDQVGYESGLAPYVLDVGDGSGTTVNSTYFEGDGGTYSFLISNSLSDSVVVTFLDGTINQGQNFGFYSGAEAWVSGEDKGGLAGLEVNFGGETMDVLAGEKAFLEYKTTLGEDGTVLLTFTFDSVECVGSDAGGCPDIDFVVSATPVPLPAAGFLLLGGLGGLAMMRRRKKS